MRGILKPMLSPRLFWGRQKILWNTVESRDLCSVTSRSEILLVNPTTQTRKLLRLSWLCRFWSQRRLQGPQCNHRSDGPIHWPGRSNFRMLSICLRKTSLVVGPISIRSSKLAKKSGTILRRHVQKLCKSRARSMPVWNKAGTLVGGGCWRVVAKMCVGQELQIGRVFLGGG